MLARHMTGFLDILKSERGVVLLGLLIGSVVLAALGHMTIQQWTDYSKWLFGAYAISKGATGVAALFSSAKVQVAKTEEFAADHKRAEARIVAASAAPSVIVDPTK